MLTQLHETLRNVVGSADVFVLAHILIGCVLIIISIHLLTACSSTMNFNRKRRDKQQRCMETLGALKDSVNNISTNLIENVEKLTATEIVEKIRSKQLSPQEVLQVYQYKALEAHARTNCLCEPIPTANEAAVNAVHLNGKLCGVPVSLKECIAIKGLDCCVGFAREIDEPYPDDSVIVKVLRHHGAVPFVRTNVAQGLMAWETSNPVFGLTINPHSPDEPHRTVGGSSGGEAALVACGGSILGMGNDTGGSLRCPAAMCGVATFKSTSKRTSNKGNYQAENGQTNTPEVYGPISCDVNTLALAMDALWDPYMWQLDPAVVPLPFNRQVYESTGPLTIGYYDNSDYFEAVPAMKRGVELARELLENRGHKLVEWKFKRRNFHKDGDELFGLCAFGDGGREVVDILKNEKTDMAVGRLSMYLSIPKFLVRFAGSVLKRFASLADIAFGLQVLSGVRSVSEWWKLTADNQKLRQDMIEEWREFGFDAVLTPGFACPALTAGTPSDVIGSTCYLTMYNQVDFPAGSLPVTHVTQEDEDAMTETYPTVTNSQRSMKQGLIGGVGLPVNVQVVALPFHDELCLRVMKELESAVLANQETVKKSRGSY